MDNLKYYREGITKLNRSYDFVLDGEEDTTTEGPKDSFDRTEFYLEYYKNLTPSDFSIEKIGNKITIEIPNRKS